MADHLLANKFSNLSVGFFCSEWLGTLEIVNCFKNLVSTGFIKAQQHEGTPRAFGQFVLEKKCICIYGLLCPSTIPHEQGTTVQ